ncbi:4-hydroxy-2-oxoglutarate aldolase @ 2-dehydro-3-deoxyphosphogluconate aldolase [hydrothermal vent metagenome]|uniref:2-dehydro-3-deoxy-phosphogluconate aldolase n=1 Tax=hydrothermal vent metagenome TaxID=652676 RepID=A0A3B0TJC6_9ZZZZ
MSMMEQKQARIEATLKLAPVVPVLVVDDASTAVPLAQALVRGGLKAIEVTLRTSAALDAIALVAAEVEGAVPGVGTVLTAGQFDAAARAGAKFAVSPGGAPELFDAAENSDIPLLPGAATASEVMAALERGYRFQKFFPAGQAGGAAYLKALASPLQSVKFCPTGGVNLANAPDYLGLGNVICVGGSWVAPKAMVAAGDWDGIEALARQAAALGG